MTFIQTDSKTITLNIIKNLQANNDIKTYKGESCRMYGRGKEEMKEDTKRGIGKL